MALRLPQAGLCVVYHNFIRQYLEDKEKSEFTSQESYVWRKLDKGDTSFYPVGKAIALEHLNPDNAT